MFRVLGFEGLWVQGSKPYFKEVEMKESDIRTGIFRITQQDFLGLL